MVMRGLTAWTSSRVAAVWSSGYSRLHHAAPAAACPTSWRYGSFLPSHSANCFSPLSSDAGANVTIVFPASVDSSTRSPVERDGSGIWTGDALAHLAGLLPPGDSGATTDPQTGPSGEADPPAG